MEEELLSDLFLLCRLCINTDGKFAVIPGTQIHTAIKEIYGVKIDPYDGFSQLLCHGCKNKLQYILKLRATFIANQEILAAFKKCHEEEKLKNNSVGEIRIKLEPPEHDECEMTNDENDQHTQSENTQSGNKESTVPQVLPAQEISEKQPKSTDDSIPAVIDEEIDRKFVDVSNQIDFEYFCRLCNNSFLSVFSLQEHVKVHWKLIRLQRRYTPYMCSVKMSRYDNDSGKPSTKVMRKSHPLFYMKRKSNFNIDNYSTENPTGSDTDNMDNDHYSDGGNEMIEQLCVTSETVNNEKNLSENSTLNSVFETTIPHIERMTCSNFNEILYNEKSFGEDNECKADSFNEQNLGIIDDIIFKKVLQFANEESDTELKLTQYMMCRGRVKINWKENRTDIVNIAFNYQFSNYNRNFEGFTVVRNSVAKKSTALSSYEHVNLPHLVQASPNRISLPSHEFENEAIYDDETNTETHESTVQQVLPLIVSAVSLEPTTIVTETTSAYIDLESDDNTIYSDQSPELSTPIKFYQYVLEKEYFYMSMESPSEHAVVLACYKKNLEDRDFVLSVLKDDNIYYIEVCIGDTRIELEKENAVTQWLLLSSICEFKVETLMKNYAKKFRIDIFTIDKFIKIMRSVSGSVTGETVKMEAPKMLFF